ncbi:hypothetical protein [uncultured Psychroserpens sp.]|uniref:hypothetical protein n=1 Tax=uncultured Psychroserpens sp. TaxID=255436 RepID=UPI00261B5253|nr:hypothetical protein [uncultured Psychroserpens sp.]
MSKQSYLTGLIFLLLSISAFSQTTGNTYRSEYYAHLPFWESPYQPFKMASPITQKMAKKRIHVQVDYDIHNRIIATHIKIGNHYKDFEGFFGNIYVNASLTKVEYENNKEFHSFYDRFGNQISVQGKVYKKVYHKDEYGRNIKLTFLDAQRKETLDQIGVKSYNWTHQDDGSIIEERFNEKGVIVPLRGYFDFGRVRMTFDNQGYFKTLQNIDEDGNLVNTENGAAVFQYYYDLQGRFDRWEVYDKDNKKAKGPSNTAGEQNTYHQYELEDIIFFDTNGDPATHWSGAQRWHFGIDTYGNFTSLEFQDHAGNPINANNDYSKYVWNWSENGRYMTDEAYFDKAGKPTVHKQLAIHKVVYKRNRKGLIVSITYLDVNDNVANRIDGIALVNIRYDKNDLELERTYYDKDNNLVKK